MPFSLTNRILKALRVSGIVVDSLSTTRFGSVFLSFDETHVSPLFLPFPGTRAGAFLLGAAFESPRSWQ